MGELSVHFCEDAITFADGGEFVGRLKNTSVDSRGLEEFVKLNYSMQGNVKYQSFLQGVVAGLSLAFGPTGEPRADLEEISPTDDIGHSVVELTGDGTGQAAPELLPGEIVVPGHTVIDGITVGTVADEEHGALTPSRSPETIVPVSESQAAVASPDASGTVSP